MSMQMNWWLIEKAFSTRSLRWPVGEPKRSKEQNKVPAKNIQTLRIRRVGRTPFSYLQQLGANRGQLLIWLGFQLTNLAPHPLPGPLSSGLKTLNCAENTDGFCVCFFFLVETQWSEGQNENWSIYGIATKRRVCAIPYILRLAGGECSKMPKCCTHPHRLPLRFPETFYANFPPAESMEEVGSSGKVEKLSTSTLCRRNVCLEFGRALFMAQ